MFSYVIVVLILYISVSFPFSLEHIRSLSIRQKAAAVVIIIVVVMCDVRVYREYRLPEVIIINIVIVFDVCADRYIHMCTPYGMNCVQKKRNTEATLYR